MISYINVVLFCLGSVVGMLATIIVIVWYVQRIPSLNKVKLKKEQP